MENVLGQILARLFELSQENGQLRALCEQLQAQAGPDEKAYNAQEVTDLRTKLAQREQDLATLSHQYEQVVEQINRIEAGSAVNNGAAVGWTGSVPS